MFAGVTKMYRVRYFFPGHSVKQVETVAVDSVYCLSLSETRRCKLAETF